MEDPPGTDHGNSRRGAQQLFTAVQYIWSQIAYIGLHMVKRVPLQWQNGRLIPVLDTDLADFPNEKWKVIPDYEDYLLSNLGRVKSIERVVITKTGSRLPVSEKILKLDIKQEKGSIAIKVGLRKADSRLSKYFVVPRLLYILFVGPLEYSNKSIVVGRKDGNPLNCYSGNLVLQVPGKSLRKPVNQYDKHGNFVKHFASVRDAATELQIPISQITEALSKKYLQGRTSFWRGGDPVQVLDISEWQAAKKRLTVSRIRPVQKIALDGTPMESYESIKAAVEALQLKSKSAENGIIKACSSTRYTAYGFRWCYLSAPGGKIVEGIPAEAVNFSVNRYNKPVHRYNINGVFMRTYPSPSSAAKELNVGRGSISAAVASPQKMIRESYWRQGRAQTFIDVAEYHICRERYFSAEHMPVQKLTIDGKLIETFPSITTAANAVGIKNMIIAKACKNPNLMCVGFRWRYAPKKS